ncbi:UDP-N-acetylmuramoyl-L-alanyl-D-glutamate--2,6-diaminopimelate ligase [soil metagenome]
MSEAASRPLGTLIAALEARGLLRTMLADGVEAPIGALPIRSVTADSRRVAPGDLFVAIPGQHSDGHDFVPVAVAQGAAAIIAERPFAGLGVPQLLVSGSRPALALAAAWWYGFPSEELGIIGVTGTDGKTTTSYLVRAMLEACGLRTGVVGTIDVIVGGRALGDSGRSTTPEAPQLQAHLAAMIGAGDRFAIVESTSHGLAQERVGAVAYDVALLTNVTHEHLEFHGTHEAYRAAKRRLFERLAVTGGNPDKGWGKTGVLNRDDRWFEEFAGAVRGADARLISYGADDAADVRATRVEEDARRLRVGLRTRRWEGLLEVRLAGRFNVHNALAAVAVGEALKLDPVQMRAGLESLTQVPGRMERVDYGQPFGVIVDYAHSPEALAKVLDNLAPLAAASGGGLVCVFGSAGERDVQKRPMMGRIAAERCRLVIVTDEDPRGEDRLRILGQIAAGAEQAGKRRDQDLLLIPDRAVAIATALELARPGEVVLLASKGNEQTTEVAECAIPWD